MEREISRSFAGIRNEEKYLVSIWLLTFFFFFINLHKSRQLHRYFTGQPFRQRYYSMTVNLPRPTREGNFLRTRIEILKTSYQTQSDTRLPFFFFTLYTFRYLLPAISQRYSLFASIVIKASTFNRRELIESATKKLSSPRFRASHGSPPSPRGQARCGTLLL